MKAATLKMLQDLGGFVLAGDCSTERMKKAAEIIRAARNYRWVGIYKVTKKEFAIMAATGGEPVAYPRFPLTQGLCGAVLESGRAITVGDVRKDPRYLPTFHSTRSELIIPIANEQKRIIGMLDAESEKVNAFADEDRQFLERAACVFAHCLDSK